MLGIFRYIKFTFSLRLASRVNILLKYVLNLCNPQKYQKIFIFFCVLEQHIIYIRCNLNS